MSSKKKASSQHKTKGSSSSSLSDQDDNETQVIDIIKFPRTPHLFATNKDVSRDDLVGELYALLSANNNGYILYGEWVYAKHSILYDKLPDTFIAFDIYDKHAEKFVSVQKRNQLLNLHAPTLCVIEQIPNNNGASLTMEYLMHLLNTYKSHYSSTDEPIEGVYIRIDEGDYLKKRAKVVRSDFIQAIDTHWSTMELVKNRIDFSLKKY